MVIVLFLTISQWRGAQGSVFKSKQKVPWWMSGLSLYMLFLSMDQGQLISGIIAEHGMQGMWILWAGNLGVFVVPIVFAPLWHKLNFTTDNQFILFRFPGKTGKWLHQFRALYVGGLVVTLALSFHLIGFARIIQVFYNVSPLQSTLIAGGLMTLFALKNILDIKLKIDVLHTLLFLLSFILIVFFVGKAIIFEKDWMHFLNNNPKKRDIFPSNSTAWFSMFVYLGIQWWSCNLFDGGGAETSRFTAVKTSKDAVKAALTPIILSVIIGFFMGIHVIALLGLIPMEQIGEVSYVSALHQMLPPFVKDLVFLGFFAMFITTAESLLNWGASLLVVDTWVHWFKKRSSIIISILTMVLLSGLSVLVALNVRDLQQLIKITFSISAGVAPVFILRWVWLRINAWTQLSAMLSSGLYTLLYPWFHMRSPWSKYPMEETRIFCVTILTIATWIIVTFLTKNQYGSIQERMLTVIHTSLFIKRLGLSLLLGLLLTTLIILGWWILLN